MLADLAQHDDPNVVVQAARGLVAAIERQSAESEQAVIAQSLLNVLSEHRNEVVRDFVRTESNNRTLVRGGGG